MSSERAWDQVSDDYFHALPPFDHTVHYGRFCPDESQLGLLRNVEGLRTIDLGAGCGHNAVAMSLQGAIVTAVDHSQNQLHRAGALSAQYNTAIKFVHEDAVTFLASCAPESVDLILSTFVLGYVKNVSELLAYGSRSLAPGGTMVVSVDHPMAQIVSMASDDVVVSESYFDAGARPTKWPLSEKKSVAMTVVRRTMEQYFRYLLDARLQVVRLIEPEPTDEFGGLENKRDQAIFSLVPSTLILVCQKG